MDNNSPEFKTLRRNNRDIIAISSLPSIWVKYDVKQVADSLVETLVGSLSLDFCYLYLNGYHYPITTAYSKNGFLTEQALKRLSTQLEPWISVGNSNKTIQNFTIGSEDKTFNLACAPIGMHFQNGTLILASERKSFPIESERLIMNLASNQANVTVLHKWAIEELQEEKNLREHFVAALTHDLRTPLTATKISAQILDKAEDPSKKKKLVERIVNNMNRADNMIRDILDVNRVKAGEKIPLEYSDFELRSFVTELVEEFASIHGDRFRFDAQDEIYGRWDQEALKRILENLLSNAVKYGDVVSQIFVKLDRNGEDIILSVKNSGNPISDENREKIFVPYHRTQSAFQGLQKGWGIGLSLVKALTNAHGGSIELHSSAENGTVFSIKMPVRV